jgi:hypothetical protein
MSEDVEDFVLILDSSIMVAHRRHESSEATSVVVALVFANVFVEQISYKVALVTSPHSADGQKAMQLEFDSVTTNQT